MDRRENCFNFIRLLAALEVFIGHGCEHFKIIMPSLVREAWLCFRGVPVFFILSGFLIWNSLGRAKSFKNFCIKRVVRMYPELWIGVLLNAIIMLVVYRKSISILPFAIFQITQSTVFQFWTPGSLRGYGCGVPNGALWTIGVMMQSYLVIWFIYKWIHKKKASLFFFALMAGIAFNIGTPLLKNFLPEIIYKLFTQTFFPYIWLFVLGGGICEYFDQLITWLKKFWFIFLGISVLISVSHLESGIGMYETVKSLCLGLAIIGFGYSFPRIRIRHDFSFGIYIYHMIVINLMLELGYTGRVHYIATALIISVLLAAMSYFMIGSIGRNARKKIV